MKIVRTQAELLEQLNNVRQEKKSVGFVPTMGFLHEGHQSLLTKAKEQNDYVVLSIFVNPLQFGPNEDFDRYPRNEVKDTKIAEEANVDLLFIPSVEEIYPRPMSIKMNVVQRTNVLCGKKREGHFDGVVTILTKLFHLIQPTRAYFGLKDAQQVAIIEGLITDFSFPIHLVTVPTVREEDGLAKSSRNVYLNENERAEAPLLQKGLQKGQELALSKKYTSKEIIDQLMKEYDRLSGELDYLEIYSYPELEVIQELKGQVIIAVAYQYEKARLIDNTIFTI
jgi:pantoate--beta-alanine ligase